MTTTIKQELLDQIKILQDKVDTLLDDADTDTWPNMGDRYWFVYVNGVVSSYTWTNTGHDNKVKNNGNMFRTEEGAELKSRQNKVLASMREISGTGVFDTLNGHTVYYIPATHKWKVSELHGNWVYAESVRFPSKELAQRAIDTLDLDCLLEVAR